MNIVSENFVQKRFSLLFSIWRGENMFSSLHQSKYIQIHLKFTIYCSLLLLYPLCTMNQLDLSRQLSNSTGFQFAVKAGFITAFEISFKASYLQNISILILSIKFFFKCTALQNSTIKKLVTDREFQANQLQCQLLLRSFADPFYPEMGKMLQLVFMTQYNV